MAIKEIGKRPVKRGRFNRARTTITAMTGEIITFDSFAEAYRFKQLEILQSKGVITGLDRQVKFPIEIDGTHICNYVADFVYIALSKDGAPVRKVVEDVKSAGTAKDGVYKLKKKMFEAQYHMPLTEKFIKAKKPA